MNTFLGIGGIISMIASPILAFSGLKSSVDIHEVRIVSIEGNYKEISGKIEKQNNLLIKIATKLNVNTDSLTSIIGN